MTFGWVQMHSNKGEAQRWVLIDRKSREMFLTIRLSDRAEHRHNTRLMRRIRMLYEVYYGFVCITGFEF